jgi:hypothetical protein
MTAEEVKAHVIPVDRLYIARERLEVVGFASLNFCEDFSYLAGTAVHPSKQGSGLYSSFARFRILDSLDMGFEQMKTRTQNPIIEHTLRKAFSSLVREGKISSFSVQRELVQGIFGRMLTKEIPKSRDETINIHYASLDYRGGDAFMLSFEVKR